MNAEDPVAQKVLVAGIGRMGKGIALAFAYAGYPVVLADSEDRPASQFAELRNSAEGEWAGELRFLAEAGVLAAGQAGSIAGRILVVPKAAAAAHLGAADFVFEAVAEVREIKQEVYAWLNGHLSDTAIVSSTTSTMSANDLAALVRHPERFVNAHWLNPAHLMPLVEVSPGDRASPQAVESLKSLLAGIGKVPVVCASSPGFIVPRIQAVAMNEAARLVEEGVASVEDVDLAIKVGFGIRFATLGLLEFIDWGGGDTLYHATRYLERNLDPGRFSVPGIVAENMAKGHNGMRDGAGFYDWNNRDIETYRKRKLTELVSLLQHRGLMPRFGPRPGPQADPPADTSTATPSSSGAKD